MGVGAIVASTVLSAALSEKARQDQRKDVKKARNRQEIQELEARKAAAEASPDDESATLELLTGDDDQTIGSGDLLIEPTNPKSLGSVGSTGLGFNV